MQYKISDIKVLENADLIRNIRFKLNKMSCINSLKKAKFEKL